MDVDALDRIVREAVLHEPGDSLAAMHWLEQVIKTLDAASDTAPVVSSAYFSPGESCLRRLGDLMRGCHARGVQVRVFGLQFEKLWQQFDATPSRG